MPARKKETPEHEGHVVFKVEKERVFADFVRYLKDPWGIIWRNLLAGTAQGVGIILGTAIVLSILGFIFNSVLGEIPFFSDFADSMNVLLEQSNN